MSKIKDIPLLERPREKAKIYGIESLSNEELFALIIGSGTKEYSSLDIARLILSSSSSLEELFNNTTYLDLKLFKGLSEARALALASTFELNKRAFRKNEISIYLYDKFKVAQYFHNIFKNEEFEKLYVVLLTKSRKLIAIRNVYGGTKNVILINPNEILKICAKFDAKRFYLIHNHPSGNSSPSKEDEEQTRVIELLTNVLGISLEDHLVIGEKTFYSLIDMKEYDIDA